MPVFRETLLTRRIAAAGTAALGATTLLGRVAGAGQDTSPVASPSPDAPRLLLRMESVGGTLPAELQLVAVPEFSLFDDGSVYRLGPVVAIYPPAALPNVTRMRLAESGVASILEQARDAGLDEARELTDPATSEDTPVHRFQFRTDGGLVETTAGNLYTEREQSPGSSPDDAAAYERLRALAAFLSSIPTNLAADALLEAEMPVDPDRLQLISFEATPGTQLPSGIPNLEQPPLAWPLSPPLAEISTDYAPESGSALQALACTVISGEEAQAVVMTSRQGDLTSPWIDGDITYGLLLKPLLPDEAGCAPIAR